MGAGAASILLNQVRVAEATGGPPPRFVFFIEDNGVIPDNFMSSTMVAALNGAGGSSTAIQIPNANLSSAPSLGSLAAQGGISLEEDSMVVLGLTSNVGGGHTTHFGALSCSPSTAENPGSATIDHVLASIPNVRGPTPYDAVRLGIHSKSTSPFNYSSCASGYNSPVPVICNAQIAYSNLFGSVASGAGAQGFTNQRRLLDFARLDVDHTLSGLGGNPILAKKFEQYGQALDTLIARHETILGMSDILAQVAPPGPGESPLYQGSQLDHLEAMADLAKAALLGGLANVITIFIGGGGSFDLDYSRLGYSERRHSLCHANNYTALRAITQFQVNLMTSIARTLKATPEGSGTMLDNTVLVYGSGSGPTHHHNGSGQWPFLLIGGSNLGFGPGNRAIYYPERQVSNLFSTLTYAGGQGIPNFGNDAYRIASGPLSEIWAA